MFQKYFRSFIIDFKCMCHIRSIYVKLCSLDAYKKLYQVGLAQMVSTVPHTLAWSSRIQKKSAAILTVKKLGDVKVHKMKNSLRAGDEAMK